MITEVKKLVIDKAADIRTAMEKLNQLGRLSLHNTLIVVEDDRKLVGSLNDGDIRRAFLNGYSMDSKVGEVCRSDPIVAPEGMPDESMRQLLRLNKINLLPIVNGDENLVGVKRLESSSWDSGKGFVALIMAGGEGLRLRPLTEKTPKPMLKVGGKPILQTIIELLSSSGCKKVFISINYLHDIIKDYFKDGSELGVDIRYIQETKYMGTAGSLALIPEDQRPDSPFLVINGDILTTLNMKAFRDFHIATDYDFTICCYPHKTHLPYGCPIIEGDLVTGFREKPIITHLVNSGIYCISSEIINMIKGGRYIDMPDLIEKIIKKRKRVGIFPLREEIHEVGCLESYEKAEEFYKKAFTLKVRPKTSRTKSKEIE